ncbi:MAG: restriction endonuclease subunit S [Lentisphaerae bacterium]|nr:restriction endonuclease subunit S [Lentisphaerota bacterium]
MPSLKSWNPEPPMSSKTKTITTKEDGKVAGASSSKAQHKGEQDAPATLLPKLRFPEFREAEGWAGEKLGSKTKKVGSGITPTGGEKNYKQSGRPFVRSQNIGWGELLLDDVAFIDETTHNSFSSTQIDVFDVLLNITGASIGRSVVADARIEGGNVNQHVCIIRVKPDELSPYFLNQYLISHDGQKQIDSFQAGGNRQGLNFEQIRSFLIPLPADFPEQQKIAECLSSVDELIGAQARKVDALKTHKKGLMQQLFPRQGETQPRLRFPEFQNAGEWSEEKLDDLIHLQDGFAFKSTDFLKVQDGATQVIRITDINNKNTNEDKVYIPTAFLESNKLGKYSVDDGDLLLSLTGAAGFNFFFWNGGIATINQRTAKVTSKKKSGHALLRLLEPLIHEKINERGEGQNNNLSKEFLSTIVLRVPEPEEQHRIASCLSSLDARITAEAQKLEALKTHKKGLMQQLFPNPEELAP